MILTVPAPNIPVLLNVFKNEGSDVYTYDRSRLGEITYKAMNLKNGCIYENGEIIEANIYYDAIKLERIDKKLYLTIRISEHYEELYSKMKDAIRISFSKSRNTIQLPTLIIE